MLGRKNRPALMQTSDRLSELDLYTELLATLHDVLVKATLQSPALTSLRDDVARVIALPDYQRLREELPALREPLRNIGSLTIGINLDDNLRPVSAVLMGINPFDQFGVELGKKMAKDIDAGEGEFDASTRALMEASGLG